MANILILVGFVISSDGDSVDQRKVRVVQEWPILINVHEIRSFMGLQHSKEVH